MKNERCFVCGSNKIREKYLLPSASLQKLEGSETETEISDEEVEIEVLHEAVKIEAGSASTRTGSFLGYQNGKFKKIQQTLFNMVLQVTPSICPKDNATELPVKLCHNCEIKIFHVYSTHNEIKKLQNDLDKISLRIVDSAISSVVDQCFSADVAIEDYKKLLQTSRMIKTDADGNITNIKVDKILPIDSVDKKLYSKWKSKFCKAFGAKLETHPTASPVEPFIEHYEEEAYSSQETHIKNVRTRLRDPLTDDGELESQSNLDEVEKEDLGKEENKSASKKSILETTLKPNTTKRSLPNRRSSLASGRKKKSYQDLLSDKIHRCADCGQICKRKTTFQEHMEIHHNENIRKNGTYQCPECSNRFLRLLQLENHLSFVHGKIKLEFEWCKQCKIMANKSIDHVCKTFSKTCPTCDQDFSTLNSYKLHRKEVCLNSSYGEKGSRYFNCDLCPKKFNRKQGLMYHKKIHKGIKDFKCDVCTKTFASKIQLQVHTRVHTGEKPYICDICGLAFSSTPSLISHKKTHQGVKPHQCDVCSKFFRSLGHLNTHKVIHTGEKPYMCSICQKSFNRKENLRSHEFTHAKVKPHICTICPDSSFVRASLLRSHMNTRHKKLSLSAPAKPTGNAIKSKSTPTTGQLTASKLVFALTDRKDNKTQVRVVKGGRKAIIPISAEKTLLKPVLLSETKNVAYLVAGNPGKYIILKNMPAATQNSQPEKTPSKPQVAILPN